MEYYAGIDVSLESASLCVVDATGPLAATEEELQKIAGFSPDIEKSRAEAKFLKDASAEGLSFELLNRNIDQPYKPAFSG